MRIPSVQAISIILLSFFISSTTHARFLQTDPMGYEDNLNLYAYVGNNPMNAVDPTGMFCVDWDADTCELKFESDNTDNKSGAFVGSGFSGEQKDQIRNTIDESRAAGDTTFEDLDKSAVANDKTVTLKPSKKDGPSYFMRNGNSTKRGVRAGGTIYLSPTAGEGNFTGTFVDENGNWAPEQKLPWTFGEEFVHETKHALDSVTGRYLPHKMKGAMFVGPYMSPYTRLNEVSAMEHTNAYRLLMGLNKQRTRY